MCVPPTRPVNTLIPPRSVRRARRSALRSGRPALRAEVHRSSASVPEQCADSNLQFLRVAGAGTFAKVFEAVLSPHERVAVKKFSAHSSSSVREIHLWKQLSSLEHPNVMRLRHHYISLENGLAYHNAIMDFYPLNLSQVVKQCTARGFKIHINYTRLFSYQVARGLLFLHSQGIAHRDLKPSNVMVNPETNVVRITDFGFAKVLRAGEHHSARVGTPFYRAPELLLGATKYSTSVDMWSFACMFAELILSGPLFRTKASKCECSEIFRVFGRPTAADLAAMSERQLTVPEMPPLPPRPFDQLFGCKACTLQQAWQNKASAISLLEGLLQYNPSSRLNPLQVLAHPFFDALRSPQHNTGLPRLFDFSDTELAVDTTAVADLIPAHLRPACAGSIPGEAAASSASA